MRKAFLLSLAALPLLAFDCGGTDPEPAYDPFGCTLSVRGAVSEDLWCDLRPQELGLHVRSEQGEPCGISARGVSDRQHSKGSLRPSQPGEPIDGSERPAIGKEGPHERRRLSRAGLLPAAPQLGKSVSYDI